MCLNKTLLTTQALSAESIRNSTAVSSIVSSSGLSGETGSWNALLIPWTLLPFWAIELKDWLDIENELLIGLGNGYFKNQRRTAEKKSVTFTCLS